MELSFDPAILLLGIYPKNPETPIQNNLSMPMFKAVVFTIANCQKQPNCPSVNEWIKKLWYIYIMENMQQIEGTPAFYDRMNGTEEYYAK